MMDAIFPELRAALRSLRKNLVFTGFAVASLALGIGANAAIFSAVKTVLAKPLAVAEPGRLVAIFSANEKNLREAPSATTTAALYPISYEEYKVFRDSDVFSEVLVTMSAQLYLLEGQRPEKIEGALVSGNYFDLLGVPAHLGRTFLPEEDVTPGTHPVIVLSYDFWQRRFAGEPEVIGRTLRLNGHAFTVVGVASPGFSGLQTLTPRDFWVPAMMHDQVLSGILQRWFKLRDGHILMGVGRLAAATDLAAAQAAMASLAQHFRQEYPTTHESYTVVLRPLVEATISPNLRDNYVLAGQGLMLVVGLLLLIAAANVGNMLLARALARRREVGIRVALGASHGRLLRQFLIEGLVLALAGGAAGLLVAFWGSRILWRLKPPMIPDSLTFSLDAQVLLFTLAVSTLVGLFFGLAPTAQAFRFDVASVLHNREGSDGGAATRLPLRTILVALQAAVSVLALVGAGLFAKGLASARGIDLGFEPRNLILASFDLSPSDYGEERGLEFYRQLRQHAETLPGVRSASFSERVPLVRWGFLNEVTLEGRELPPDLEGLMIPLSTVDLDFFPTLGIGLLKGRGFTAADRPDGLRVAIVNETMEKRFWNGESALGKRFVFPDEGAPIEVVGVAEDSTCVFVGENPSPHIYLPLAQGFLPALTLFVRTETDPGPLLPTIRRELEAFAPTLPVHSVRIYSELMEKTLWPTRLSASLLSLFAGLAVVLTVVGLYGVLSFIVHRRAREVGIRMALGGRRGQIVGLIIRQGMGMVLGGIALGLVASAFTSSRFSHLLFGVSGYDPLIFGAAVLLLVAVTATASYWVSLKATAVDPLVVLRSE